MATDHPSHAGNEPIRNGPPAPTGVQPVRRPPENLTEQGSLPSVAAFTFQRSLCEESFPLLFPPDLTL